MPTAIDSSITSKIENLYLSEQKTDVEIAKLLGLNKIPISKHCTMGYKIKNKLGV